MTTCLNIAIEDELLDKIEKQHGNISLEKFIVAKLKERIEEYDTTRGHSLESPFDKFKQNKEDD
jgi:hypothetical protein